MKCIKLLLRLAWKKYFIILTTVLAGFAVFLYASYMQESGHIAARQVNSPADSLNYQATDNRHQITPKPLENHIYTLFGSKLPEPITADLQPDYDYRSANRNINISRIKKPDILQSSIKDKKAVAITDIADKIISHAGYLPPLQEVSIAVLESAGIPANTVKTKIPGFIISGLIKIFLIFCCRVFIYRIIYNRSTDTEYIKKAADRSLNHSSKASEKKFNTLLEGDFYFE